MSAYDRHLEEMEKVRQEMKKSSGMRRNDLKKRLDELEKERLEYIAWHKIAYNK